MVSAALGVFLFAVACFIYLRYAATDLHLQERVHHPRAIGLSWTITFYGAVLLFLLSLFGLRWSRWVGLILSGGAFLCDLMTLGALCGPFGC